MTLIPLFKVAMSDRAAALIAEVLASGYIGQGPKVEEFEASFHELIGTPVRPLMVNSATSAITLALALAGVGPGDEVISTPMTCLATNLPIRHHYATPVWADVHPVTGLIDPADVARKVTAKTKAIIAVDWSGRHCDYRALKSLGPPVIQDAAHCLRIDPLNCGDYVCWSFQAIKFLTTADGGALLVPQAEYERAKLMRWFGLDRTKGESFRCSQNVRHAGYKFQMTDIAAAMGLVNIEVARRSVEATRANARFLDAAISNSAVISPPPDPMSSYWLYTVLTPGRRDEFIEHLSSRGVTASPVHSRNDTHEVFAPFACDNLPGVDHFASSEAAIPVGWWLSDTDRRQVADAVNEWQP